MITSWCPGSNPRRLYQYVTLEHNYSRDRIHVLRYCSLSFDTPTLYMYMLYVRNVISWYVKHKHESILATYMAM